MGKKRVIYGLLGFIFILAVMILGNEYVIDVLFGIIAIVGVHEFYNAFTEKAKPVRWVGYLSAIFIMFIHIIPNYYLNIIFPLTIPFIMTLLFSQVIITKMKINFYDIAVTFMGIAYAVAFTMFVPMIFGLTNGKILIWYLMFIAWGTDVFAYYIGKNLGKHKLTKISPNKTKEGCIGGIIGAVIFTAIYTIVVNKYFGLNINYLYIIIVAILGSMVSQIGDLAASSVKRYTGVKDFGNLIPGHGGIIDRFDSIIFIAPFMYALLFSIM